MKLKLKYPVTQVAAAVGRPKNVVYRALSINLKKPMLKRGRHKLLSKKDIDHLVAVLKQMIRKANARYEITLAVLKKRSRTIGCSKTLRKALASRNIKFRKLRSKPILTKADRKARYAFATLYRRKSVNFWLKHIHIHIDCKTFPAYVSAKGRDYAAMRDVRGAYRQPGQALDEAYVVARKDLRFNPGATPVKIAGGVGNGKMLLWHDTGKRWDSKVAAQMYEGPLLNAPKNMHLGKRSFRVLEDNDAASFKSLLAEDVKNKCHIHTFAIPKRSPDFNVMDYSIWREINRKMRTQERRMPRRMRETRARYIQRLARAAKSLSANYIMKAIGNLKRRCELLYQAKGGHFHEGC